MLSYISWRPKEAKFSFFLMGDYGWSMDFDTSQDIVAVEYGRVMLVRKEHERDDDG